jgi:NAD(P)-dependent dehydrogenase (short-subunit alcohol dehydrogenase family)
MGKRARALGTVSGGGAARAPVALITGGSRGIGLACAEALAERGARVAVTYRSNPPPSLNGWLALPCDVRRTEDVDAVFDKVGAELGPVEILVANAGITDDNLVLRMSDESWARVVDTNLGGAFRVARRAARGMVRARRGRIVFVSSVTGFTGLPGQANYAASKAGLVGLARALARELASRSITVNVVAPGPVRTDMLEALGQESVDQLAAAVPLGRVAEPTEVAAVVGFLASPEAGYMTGAVVPVDGGLAMGL